MAGTTRAEVVRRTGAGVVALVALGAAATQYGSGTWVMLTYGLQAMLGEGEGDMAAATFRAVLAGGLPALTLTLGLVPAAALVLVSASRSDRPSPRAARVLVGLVVAGALLLVVGMLGVTSDVTGVRLAMESWFFAVGSPRTLAGVWLAIVAAGVSTAAVGVLLRRRGAVATGAALVAVGALAAALAAGASMAWAVWAGRHYRGGLPPLAAVMVDGLLATGFVATAAAAVAGWCAVMAWRHLASWVLPPVTGTSPEALAARARRRRLVAAGTVGAVAVGLGVTVAVRVAVRETVSDVLADPVLAACVERSLGTDGRRGIAPDRFDQVGVLDCPWDGDGDQVTSLAGIERLGSVHEIDLTGQDVSDLGPLAAMTGLTSLRLTGNAAVTDLSALAGLPLTNLGLSDTGVADLQPLAQTPTLQFVGLARTAVSDLGPLARSVDLIELDVAYASVSDLSPLAGASSLTKLDVRDNRVADVGPLAALTALDELWLGGNPVTDLRPLLDAPALLGVDVEGLDLQTPGIAELREQGVYVGGQA